MYVPADYRAGQCKGGRTVGVSFQLTRALEAQAVAGNFLGE